MAARAYAAGDDNPVSEYPAIAPAPRRQQDDGGRNEQRRASRARYPTPRSGTGTFSADFWSLASSRFVLNELLPVARSNPLQALRWLADHAGWP